MYTKTVGLYMQPGNVIFNQLAFDIIYAKEHI